jgi:hypothetical protein
MTSIAAAGATAVVLAVVPHVAFANLITNGSFEAPNAVAPDNGASINRGNGLDSTWYAGASIGGWIVGQNSVDLMLNTLVNAADRRQSIDLNGDYGLGGSIYQDLTTVAGQTYHLRFALSGGYNLCSEFGPDPATKGAAVSWGGATIADLTLSPASANTDCGGPLPEAVIWTHYDYDVTASSSLTRLFFGSTIPTATAYGMFLDDVSMIAVPEPGTVNLIVAGLACIGVVGWTRRRSASAQ